MQPASSFKIFRVVAWIASIYHIILGLLGTFASADIVVPIASSVYGITPQVNPQFLYMAKFIAAYMLAFGVMMGFVALKPREHRDLVWAAVILFGIRVFDRLVYFNLLQEAFGTDMARNLVTVVPIAIIAICLLAFRPRLSAA
mgnify:CR=1 FL=1